MLFEYSTLSLSLRHNPLYLGFKISQLVTLFMGKFLALSYGILKLLKRKIEYLKIRGRIKAP